MTSRREESERLSCWDGNIRVAPSRRTEARLDKSTAQMDSLGRAAAGLIFAARGMSAEGRTQGCCCCCCYWHINRCSTLFAPTLWFAFGGLCRSARSSQSSHSSQSQEFPPGNVIALRRDPAPAHTTEPTMLASTSHSELLQAPGLLAHRYRWGVREDGGQARSLQ
jgi:hypothetical protein